MKPAKFLALGLWAAAAFLASGPAAGAAFLQPDASRSGEIILKLKGNGDQRSLREIQQALLAPLGLEAFGHIDLLRLAAVKVPAGKTQAEVLGQLQGSPWVEYCEPNYLRRAFGPISGGPNDPAYQAGRQWWLEQIQADRAAAEHLLERGAGVIIAILDTGIMLAHEDLRAALVPGIDILGNGNADDDSAAEGGHGTHVAGIAAAAVNNSRGIAGTAGFAGIRLMPVKVLDAGGSGDDLHVAQGIVWAVEHGARVLNLSFGGPAAGRALFDAVTYAREHGCVVVAAAGNYAVADLNQPNPPIYPAAFDPVIAVAACDTVGARSYYSEYGNYIDIAAPGGLPFDPQLEIDGYKIYHLEIYSTLLGPGGGTYGTMVGTSMASPMVAGAAALLLSRNLALTPDEIVGLLTQQADKTGDDPYTNGWNPYLGFGRLNVHAALTHVPDYAPKTSGPASYNYPNPFRPGIGEKTQILIPLASGGQAEAARLRIYDALGGGVRTIEVPADRVWPGSAVEWDGRNDLGHPVANGVYPYRLELKGAVYSNKIVVKN